MSKKKNSSKSSALKKQITATVALMQKAMVPFRGSRLTSVTRRSVLRPTKGALGVVPTIVEVATQHDIIPTGVTLDVVTSNLEDATSYDALLAVLVQFEGSLRDHILTLRGEAWSQAIATYGMLQGACRLDGALQADLEPAQRYFRSVRGKAKAAPVTQDPAPPVNKEAPSS